MLDFLQNRIDIVDYNNREPKNKEITNEEIMKQRIKGKKTIKNITTGKRKLIKSSNFLIQ